MRRLLGFSALAALMTAASCESPGPQLVIPTPDPEKYSAVRLDACFAVNVNEAWAVGELETKDGTTEGVILWTGDLGRRWRRLGGEHRAMGGLKPSTIHFNDRLRGMVGARRSQLDGVQRAVILRTYDGGGHWLESPLPTGDEYAIEDVHSLEFASDADGVVTVVTRAVGSAETKDSDFVTRDGGRTWTVAAFREPPNKPPDARATSFVPTSATNGWRMRRSNRPGVTIAEITASAGNDWMPVAEFAPSYVDTWY